MKRICAWVRQLWRRAVYRWHWLLGHLGYYNDHFD